METARRLWRNLSALFVLGSCVMFAACARPGFSEMNGPGELTNTPHAKAREDRLIDRLIKQPHGIPASPTPKPSSARPSPGNDDAINDGGDDGDDDDSGDDSGTESRDSTPAPGSTVKKPQPPLNPGIRSGARSDTGKRPTPSKTEIRGFWDERAKQGTQWTKFTVQALKTYGRDLFQGTAPADIAQFCPRYSRLSESGRIDFWVKLISAIAAPESSYNPRESYREGWNEANGEPVVSRGLLQISLGSSRPYGCGMNNSSELHDPRKNIECGVRILNHWIPNDGVVVGLRGKKWLGGARYWSVLRDSNRNAKPIRALLRQSVNCRK